MFCVADSYSGINSGLINDFSFFPQEVFRFATWSCEVFQTVLYLLTDQLTFILLENYPSATWTDSPLTPLLNLVEIFVEAREWSDVPRI